MNAGHDAQDARDRTMELLATGAVAELQLLRKERKAERRLADALATLVADEARLRKAQLRLERSRAAVAVAEEKLRDSQASRAAGPVRPHD